MSDFDKEAERQKLREKFDRDREKRKETERMSQLLLQGATMTNRHCDTCGDPLFRYQDQEFCATCEGRAQEAAQGDAQNAQAAASATEETEPAEAEAPQNAEATATSEPAESQQAGEGTAADRASAATGGDSRPAASAPQRAETVDARRDDGDLTAAHESLIRTLTHHAQRAEAVDDPRRATDHLKAVREAAEALSVLERGR